ncbi:MAG: di-trans,poly-cis-decaprenylcistransferase, partial [Oscillospiraceae bacterium]|nr:di-trans,poly-cis-decaprenylcistransferase [Oscillospiraceae bacterium]
MEITNIPQHIGFIMDGNGRWAKKRAMPRNFGHKQGADVFKKTINWCREFGVKAATFYAFSTENWRRPAEEVNGIMSLLRQYIKDIRAMSKEDVRFIFIGDLTAFDEDIRVELLDIMETSKQNTGFIAGVALNYGGRAEICNAARILAKKCVSGELSADDITEESMGEALYTSEMPPLDLVIRPSGEQRLSNFMIWQAAYAEFVFMDVLWPDFKKKDLEYAIKEYAGRSRRFGGV